jgi:hypothetical protein
MTNAACGGPVEVRIASDLYDYKPYLPSHLHDDFEPPRWE